MLGPIETSFSQRLRLGVLADARAFVSAIFMNESYASTLDERRDGSG
jgi:hypothetical protein